MSRKGGYKIIDLKNKELQIGVGMVYDGIYDAIESTTKQILISGLNIDGLEVNDLPVIFTSVESSYQAIIPLSTGDKYINVNDNDVVIINNA